MLGIIFNIGAGVGKGERQSVGRLGLGAMISLFRSATTLRPNHAILQNVESVGTRKFCCGRNS